MDRLSIILGVALLLGAAALQFWPKAPPASTVSPTSQDPSHIGDGGPDTSSHIEQATERVLPDSEGRIALVLCHVNSARQASLRNTALINSIVNTLPARVKVVITASDREAFTVAQAPTPGRVRFVDLPADQRFTIWPQDPFLVLEPRAGSGEKPTLLISATFGRADDGAMGQAVARHLGWSARPSELSFEGGNLVSDARTAFVGANTVMHNALRLKVEPVEVVRRFERELGRPVLVVGPAPQVIGHIDMMLTPLGGDAIALADPRAGAAIAEQVMAHDAHDARDARDARDTGDKGAIERFERQTMAAFFAHPDIKELRDADGNPIRPPDLVGRTAKAIAFSRSIAGELDKLAAVLRGRGYTVHRVPLLIDDPTAMLPKKSDGQGGEGAATDKAAGDKPGDQRSDESSDAASDDVSKGAGKQAAADAAPRDDPGPGYPWLTYNNVLLDRDGAGVTVYVPQYGLPALDRAGVKAWEKLGYTVRPVPGFAVSAMYGGALRCCVKVLQRDREGTE